MTYEQLVEKLAGLEAELQTMCKEACLLEDDVSFAGSGYYNACSSHADNCKECKEEVELMDEAGNEGNPMRAYRHSLIDDVIHLSSNRVQPIPSANFDWRKAWKLRQSMKERG